MSHLLMSISFPCILQDDTSVKCFVRVVAACLSQAQDFCVLVG